MKARVLSLNEGVIVLTIQNESVSRTWNLDLLLFILDNVGDVLLRDLEFALSHERLEGGAGQRSFW
jgi:hypothetical protein